MLILKTDTSVSNKIIVKLSKELRVAEERFTSFAHGTTRQRLAGVLCSLLESSDGKRRGELDVGLSRTELAELSGTTRETVIRVLSDFKEKGIIREKARRITLTKLGEIRKIAREKRKDQVPEPLLRRGRMAISG